MQVVLDRRGRVVAMFVHYSESVEFTEADCHRRGLEVRDEPGLDAVLSEWLGRPRVDDGRRE